MTTPTPPRRRWFQFSLRTMFVVVTLCELAIVFGWPQLEKWLSPERSPYLKMLIDDESSHEPYVTH